MATIPTLPEQIRSQIDYTLLRDTRIHPLPSRVLGRRAWILREDELSAGVTGSKLRKFASLLPQLESQETQVAGMIGGPNSNNLVGLAQMLKERKIQQRGTNNPPV